MAQDSKSRKLDQYIVRFPDGLRDRVKDAAEASGRSMNAEIVARLTESFGRDESGRIVLKLPEDLLYRMAEAWAAGTPDLRNVDFGAAIERLLEREFPTFTFDTYLQRLANRIHQAPEGDRDRLVKEANDFIATRWPTLQVGLTVTNTGAAQIYIETKPDQPS